MHILSFGGLMEIQVLKAGNLFFTKSQIISEATNFEPGKKPLS